MAFDRNPFFTINVRPAQQIRRIKPDKKNKTLGKSLKNEETQRVKKTLTSSFTPWVIKVDQP